MPENCRISLRLVPDFRPLFCGSRSMGAGGSARNRRAPLNRAGSRNRTVEWADEWRSGGCGPSCSLPRSGPILNQIFIATMIGSQQEECKDTRVVFFSNCSHSMDGFLGYGGASHFASFDRGQASQNPNPSHPEGIRHPARVEGASS